MSRRGECEQRIDMRQLLRAVDQGIRPDKRTVGNGLRLTQARGRISKIGLCRIGIVVIIFINYFQVKCRVSESVSRDLTCDHLPKAVVQVIGLRRRRGKCRVCLTEAGGRFSKVCRDLINSINILSQISMKTRVVVYRSRGLTCDHLPWAVDQGIRSR